MKTKMIILFLNIIIFTTQVRSYVRFITEPMDIVTTAGKTVMLDCEANFYIFGKIPQYRWTLNGQNLDFIGDTRRSILKNGSLVIKNVFNNDKNGISEGLESYKCVAFVDNIGVMVSRTASVILARVSPFEKQPTDLRLLPGQTGRFSCFVNSQPLPKIIWLKDNSPLVIDNRMTIFQSGALEIDDVRTEDNGAYRCNVTGLEIHSLSDPGVLTVVENEEAIKKLKAPEFVAKPYSTKALEGSIVTMDCAAVGNPRPQISWSKGGYPILLHLDTKFRIIGTGGLQIMQLNRNDEGNYVCRAKNSEGTIVVSAKIDVLVKPLFIYEPKDTLCFKEENVTLECKVTGKPPPSVIWLKNGDRIKPDEYIQFVNGTNLKIFGALVMDSGIFQCLASNVAGNIQSSAFLNVLDRDNLQDLNSSTNVSNNIVNLFSTTENPKDLKKKLISYSKTSDARVISTMQHIIMTTENIPEWMSSNNLVTCYQRFTVYARRLFDYNFHDFFFSIFVFEYSVQDSDQTIKTVNSKSNQPAKHVVEIDLRRVFSKNSPEHSTSRADSVATKFMIQVRGYFYSLSQHLSASCKCTKLCGEILLLRSMICSLGKFSKTSPEDSTSRANSVSIHQVYDTSPRILLQFVTTSVSKLQAANVPNCVLLLRSMICSLGKFSKTSPEDSTSRADSVSIHQVYDTSPRILLQFDTTPVSKQQAANLVFCAYSYFSMFHRKHCTAKCNRILACGHKCKSICGKDCSEKPCEEIVIQRRGKLACGHRDVRVLCCDIDKGKLKPCYEPYTLKLECGHECIGYCGEPCPPLCSICQRDEVTTILFGYEDEPDARRLWTNIEKIQKEIDGLPDLVTKEERQMINEAMSTSFATGNAAQGYWCKCPNNHIYCITECGGPMEQASCPECKCVIGGENHRHVSGTTVATEMDGASSILFQTVEL
ncbi:hypothetical protein QTP88_027030 [Uroleucon formosanum]